MVTSSAISTNDADTATTNNQSEQPDPNTTSPPDLGPILDHIATSFPDNMDVKVDTEPLTKPSMPKPKHFDTFRPPEQSAPDYSWKYMKNQDFKEDDEDDEYDDEDDEEEDEDDYDLMMNDFVQLSQSKGGKKGYSKRNKNRGVGIRRKDLSNYSHEYQIKRILFNNYDKTTRPVRNDSTTTTLFLGMSLYHILDTVSEIEFCIRAYIALYWTLFVIRCACCTERKNMFKLLVLQ